MITLNSRIADPGNISPKRGMSLKALPSPSSPVGTTYNQSVNSPTRIERRPANQTLLIDADDTLWENNIYFERAITSFISYLDHRIHTADEVRSHLIRVEHDTIRTHGYGLHSFRRSLAACFEQLSDAPMTDEKHRRIESFAQSIAEQEIELLPNVASTLSELATRHRLILVTKGDHDEQTDKLHRSGLAPHFTAVEVLSEKHHQAYESLVSHHACDSCSTWMIGNSPRSDVNPALSAGLNAIFIPHDFTWVLEHEAVHQPPAGRQLLELASFAELTQHF
ncbi:HAD family hydrolase [Tunturibacter empetritectus]|uniref:Hydrolase of the HAD superfamily n=1 Tax=Tunturiibacter empetritectus TaxID=3069691 RepID=A0A7W8MPL9_9BACT|nr:HAD family hydrolase [Edaphobacter lichenicola]MBB5315836.1 putative hydrolase of the HAD superfamily [Edaphobacter lichenicola]